MKRNLTIEVDCGDSTCASYPGRFCPWLGKRKFNQVQVCMLFNRDVYVALGWTRRCHACMESEQEK